MKAYPPPQTELSMLLLPISVQFRGVESSNTEAGLTLSYMPEEIIPKTPRGYCFQAILLKTRVIILTRGLKTFPMLSVIFLACTMITSFSHPKKSS